MRLTLEDLGAMVGTARYEYWMQIRRITLWVVFAVVVGLIVFLLNQGPLAVSSYLTHLATALAPRQATATWAFDINTYLPLCIGALLADRLVRDHRLRVDEMLITLPTRRGVRLAGKYLGSMLATVSPVFLVYAVGVVYMYAQMHNVGLFLWALPAFALVVLPGVAFVSAFSLAVPVLLWLPLYQFLFIGYWYWNTLWFHADLPNLARTLLSPIGLYAAMGIFGLNLSSSGGNHPIAISGTAGQGAASIAELVVCAIVVLCALDGYLAWQQSRQ